MGLPLEMHHVRSSYVSWSCWTIIHIWWAQRCLHLEFMPSQNWPHANSDPAGPTTMGPLCYALLDWGLSSHVVCSDRMRTHPALGYQLLSNSHEPEGKSNGLARGPISMPRVRSERASSDPRAPMPLAADRQLAGPVPAGECPGERTWAHSLVCPSIPFALLFVGD